MTERFVGPFPLDLQRPAAAARAVATALRAAWRGESAARPLAELRNLTPGVFGVWTPGADGLPAALTLWVTLDASWLEAGPAPGSVEPPLVVALLEALAEARWWEGAPLPAQLQPQLVLEWPPSLAARSACPAVAVYTPDPAAAQAAPAPRADDGDAPTAPPQDDPPPPVALTLVSAAPIVRDELDYDDYWEEAPAAPTSAAPMAVTMTPAAPTASATDAVDELWEEPPSPVQASPPSPVDLVPTGPSEAVAEAPVADAPPAERRPASRARAGGRVAWIAAELSMRDGVHHGRYAARRLPEVGAEPRPFVDWLRSPGGPCALPGGRVVTPLDGWLGRELELQPARGLRDGVSGDLARRALERPWRDMLRDTSVSIFGVLLLAGLVAGGAGLASSWTPEDAFEPTPPQPSPAISPCSADHAQFMEELRCQVSAMADPAAPAGARCGDMRIGQAAERASGTTQSTGVGDLRSTYCGLLHRERDGWRGNLPGVVGGTHNFAELAASQACFNVLGHPDDYTQPQSDPHRRVADPRRLLHDETFRIASLQVVVDELKTSCDAWGEALEANVRGAAFATHVGAGAPALKALGEADDSRRCDDDEQDCMRRALGAVALRSVDPARRDCFEHGATVGLGWSAGEDLCGGPAVAAEGKAWAGLAGVGADGTSPLALYVDARFPAARVRSARGVGSGVWACHLELTREEGALSPVEVAWGLRLPRPSGYTLGGAGAGNQLLLDAALTAMEVDNVDAGRCWALVRGLISAYEPVHPLLEVTPRRTPLPTAAPPCHSSPHAQPPHAPRAAGPRRPMARVRPHHVPVRQAARRVVHEPPALAGQRDQAHLRPRRARESAAQARPRRRAGPHRPPRVRPARLRRRRAAPSHGGAVLIPHGLQIHIALEPVSLLKSIDGLCAEVQRRFGDDPMGGHLFVFFNRDRTGMKALIWDNGGFIVVYKRLERGRFVVPPVRGDRMTMTHAELGALLDGIDLTRARRIPLWNPQK